MAGVGNFQKKEVPMPKPSKASKEEIDSITSQATKNKSKLDTTSRISASDKVGPNMGRGTSGLKDTLGSAMAQTSMRLADKKEEDKPKPKPKAKPAFTKLKDTSGDYYTANGNSGEMGSASGEVGADMSQVSKGGYDPESEGMKRGGKVKKMAGGGSASSRGDGCAQRGKTKGRFV